MTKQFGCAAHANTKEGQTNLALECRSIVVWAGELTDPGEEVGGIGAQNNRASRKLRLHVGVIERARAMRSGPEIAPSIFAARDNLVARLATEMRRRQSSPWRGDVHLRGMLSDGNANQGIRGSRSSAGTRAEILRVMPESPRQRSSPKKMRA